MNQTVTQPVAAGQREVDQRFMALALTLGARGLGRVWPNPAVGCVIVKNGRIVGRGWTQPGGRPHAETVALKQAGISAKGSTAYVSLEPCSHHGKTAPCSEALISAGISRVVVATTDPDPRVNGGGLKLLRDAGITVVTGILEPQARAANAGFIKRITTGLPFLSLKLASSFDGRIATASGESQWITGVQARRMVHAMRASHDGVLVGGGTARTDDPLLTVRGLGMPQQPVRIVMSSQIDLPLNGQLARTAKEIPIWICHAKDADPSLTDAWKSLGATLLSCDTGFDRQIDPTLALGALGGQGLTRIFCEGGGALAASLLTAGLVDELVGFTAGIGLGSEARPALGPTGLERLADAPRFRLVESRAAGGDLMHRWVRG